MDARAFDKSKLPTRRGTEGPSRAQRRSHDASHVFDIRRALGDGGDLSDTTVGQNLEIVKSDGDQEVVYGVAHPISATGEAVGLQGSRAREGAIVKVAGMTRLQFCGPAHVLDCEEDCFRAVESRGQGAGGKPARITARGVSMGRVGREAAAGGPSAGIGEVDLIARDPEKGVAMPGRLRPIPIRAAPCGNAPARSARPAWARSRHVGSRAEVVGYADI